ncbi:glycosyltransferase [Aeromonas caviae]|uniref:glycosyltransferase n=1 Tax=Aeromonas caviae TaxID=648 RepID=UPI002205C5DF|nr:glycosyltransferase [Aeromonas caviae]BDS28381.1 hypothetical protein KAM479c_01050 [Aeromonas caviae]
MIYYSEQLFSIVIAFYNNIDLLKIILSALDNQYDNNFEVIIADDGSKEDVVAEICRIKANYSYSIGHVWHEDKGFRKNKILNKAVQAYLFTRTGLTASVLPGWDNLSSRCTP